MPRRRWLRWMGYALGAGAALIAIAWLIVPPIARSQIETRLSDALGRPTTVESVEFNPFQLRLTVRKLAIADSPRPTPLLTFDELVARVSPASIWHRAPVLDTLKVVRPSVAIARSTAGRYNVQDLIDQVVAAPPGPPARLSINNIEIERGTVTFDDGIAGRRHALTALDVGIPFVSTLPHHAEILVKPRVSGAVNEAKFALDGSTVPFAERREATLDLTLDALPLPDYVVYLPRKPRFDLAGGSLTTRLAIVFVSSDSGERRLELRGDARLDGLTVKRRDGTPLLAAERIAVRLDRVDVFAEDANIAAVAIDAPKLDLRRLTDGTLELAQPLFEPAPATAAGTPADEDVWTVSIARLAVARGGLILVDESTGFRSELADLALDATNVSTRPGERAHLRTAFVSADRIAAFTAEADVDPQRPAANGRFAVSKFSLGLLFPYYSSALAVDVQKGSLDYASAFSFVDGNLQLTDGEATVRQLQLAVAGNRDPLWRVPELVARGIAVDVPARKVEIGGIEVRGAALRLVREADGSLEMSRILKTTAQAGTMRDDVAWTLLARKLALDRVSIDFQDRVPQPPVRIAIRDLKASARDVTNARGVKSSVELRATAGDRGRLAFNGTLVNDPLAVNGTLDASALSLVALKPYIEPAINVVLTDGRLAAKGRVTVETRNGAPTRAAWRGDVTIADFAALDRPTSSDLARWQSLTLEGVDLASEPFRAAIARIAVADFFARVIVYQDATLNLTRLLTPGASPAPAPDAKPPPAPAANTAGHTGSRLPVTIGRIELARGNVNFSDYFIRPNYSANLTDVAGSVGAMSADEAGEVKLEARVDHTAPVELQGRINPFAAQPSFDLKGKARDVDLPSLTAYSAKYAGYGIEKGKLTFEVHYRVEDRRLAAENRLVLDQLTFGPRVESPTATKLPVLLAVALLKDSRGVIDLRLPISGSLDDPQFSVGGLIIQVIANLIGKAVTAPFALLAAAFGGGEELSTLAFAAGSAMLDATAQQRVDTLAKALADRPGLKLDITGRADPVADREALNRAAVETALRRAKMKSLAAAGNAPSSLEQVTIGAEERSRWLTAAYREAPLPDRPRNVLGMLKEVPAAEMEAMLRAQATVDDEALRALANTRAQVVKDAIAVGGVAVDRLFLVAPRLGAEAGTATAGAGRTLSADAPSRVDLALR